jgi:2-iminobutanoate/2-iminopropanoate deaminase
MMGRTLAGVVVLVFVVAGCHVNREIGMEREIVKSGKAPAAIGPYSQAVRVGNTLYCSGQIAIDPSTGELVDDSIEAETRRVLDNLKAVIEETGFALSDVVKTTVYMTDMEDYAKINAVYGEYFTDSPPARAAVQVANLPKYVNVEISCIAVKSE